MTTTPFTPATRPAAIPVRDVLPWAILGGLVLLLAIYFVGAEEGAQRQTSLVDRSHKH